MSYRNFLSEIEKGLPAPAYLLYTADPFFSREAVEAIKKLVPETERDFNLHIFDLFANVDESASIQKIVETANTVSFFGGRRFTVLIVNLQKLVKKDVERLEFYTANPSPQSVFVILHIGSWKGAKREKFQGVKLLSLDMRDSEIPFWIKQRAGYHGLVISDEAVEYLLGVVGPDLGLLSAEIEKISFMGKKKIAVDDIADIITGERLYSVFDLTDALRKKDADRVFAVYKTLKETTEGFSLIGALNWQYARLLRTGISPAENEYFMKIFECLNRVDTDMKSSGRLYPVEYLLLTLLRLQG